LAFPADLLDRDGRLDRRDGRDGDLHDPVPHAAGRKAEYIEGNPRLEIIWTPPPPQY